MNKNYLQIGVGAFLISAIGVYGVDYVSHLLFSSPMETIPYFFMKFTWYFVFSVIFLTIFRNQRPSFGAVLCASIIAATSWGAYYNVLPELFDYYPYGISLHGLSFLGMGVLGTGIAFGAVHTVAFIVGYYMSTRITNSNNMNKTILGAIIAIAAIGCVYYIIANKSFGEYVSPTTTSTVPTSNTSDTMNVAVDIKNFSFAPATLTIKTGTTVTWTNNDTIAHAATSDSSNVLDSKIIAPGKSFSFTFTATGTVPYYCSLHPSMRGSVTVTN